MTASASRLVRLDGVVLDIPDAVRCFTRYTSEMRATMQASHRLGFRQRESIGEKYWAHPLVPGLAFPTRERALRAAVAAIGSASPAETAS